MTPGARPHLCLQLVHAAGRMGAGRLVQTGLDQCAPASQHHLQALTILQLETYSRCGERHPAGSEPCEARPCQVPSVRMIKWRQLLPIREVDFYDGGDPASSVRRRPHVGCAYNL